MLHKMLEKVCKNANVLLSMRSERIRSSVIIYLENIYEKCFM